MIRFCNRQPNACAAGVHLASAIGQRAQAGAKMLYGMVGEKLAKTEGAAEDGASGEHAHGRRQGVAEHADVRRPRAGLARRAPQGQRAIGQRQTTPARHGLRAGHRRNVPAMAIRGGAAYLKVADASRRDIMTIDEINENFALLDEWDDRYRYLIELGRMLPPLPDAARIDANKVQGCASQVWLTTDVERGPSGPVLSFVGDSDAHIVRGLIAILLADLFAQAGKRHSRDRCARAVRQARPARAPHAAALQRAQIDGRTHPRRRAPRARRRRGVNLPSTKASLRFEQDPKGLQPCRSCLTATGAGAAGRGPSAWRAASALRHSWARPSDSPGRGPISRGSARASCCTACAGDA